MANTIQSDRLLSVPEAAAILGTNKNRVYDLLNKGYLKFLKLGRYKIRESTLYEFIEQYDGYDLNDLDNIRKIDVATINKAVEVH